MPSTADAAPVPFTSADYTRRMDRVVAAAREAELDGVLVTPGLISCGSPATALPRSRNG